MQINPQTKQEFIQIIQEWERSDLTGFITEMVVTNNIPQDVMQRAIDSQRAWEQRRKG